MNGKFKAIGLICILAAFALFGTAVFAFDEEPTGGGESVILLKSSADIGAKEGGYRFYPLKYTTAEDIEERLDSFFSPESIMMDVAHNMIVVRDSNPAKLADMDRFMSGYNEPPKVILVEGTILRINTSDARKLGIRYEQGHNQRTSTLKKGENYGETGSAGFDLLSSVPGALPYINYSLKTESGRVMDISLETLIQEGAAEVLLKPHVTFISGTTGVFSQSTNVPQVTKDKDGNSHVETRSIGLSLVVNGYHIPSEEEGKPDSIYIKQLTITDGNVGAQVEGETAFFTTSFKVDTTQLVKDGELIILGGAISREKRDELTKVPLLGDIPILGFLFRYTSKEEVDTEMLVLLRISVVKDTTYAFKASQFEKSKGLQPIEFGGKVNDSVIEHPLKSAMWSSEIIYTEDLYFKRVRGVVADERQEAVYAAFKTRIRGRINLVQEWANEELVEKLIMSDEGLDEEFLGIASEFNMGCMDVLIIARHYGAITDEVYMIYEEFLDDKGLK